MSTRDKNRMKRANDPVRVWRVKPRNCTVYILERYIFLLSSLFLKPKSAFCISDKPSLISQNRSFVVCFLHREMGFDEIEPIFGRINAEWSAPHKTPLKPFLFHVYGLPSDPSSLHVCATDFYSNTWHALKSAQELDDMVCPSYSYSIQLTFLLILDSEFSHLLLQNLYTYCFCHFNSRVSNEDRFTTRLKQLK